MPLHYEKNPQIIETQSFQQIRELTNLDNFSYLQQQVVMRVIHSAGIPSLAAQLYFSRNACTQGMQALASNNEILCDVEMVKQGITKRMLTKEPLCFLNHKNTIALAKEQGETRAMAALHYWQHALGNSIVIIGNAPTALFRLLEMLEAGADKPALIIAIPVGFVGAKESKQALRDMHTSLGVECITLLGAEGGSAVAAAVCNALLRCNCGEFY